MLWLEAPHLGASDEYTQHMFSWRNKENIYFATPFFKSHETISVDNVIVR